MKITPCFNFFVEGDPPGEYRLHKGRTYDAEPVEDTGNVFVPFDPDDPESEGMELDRGDFRIEIEPDKLYWASFNHFEMRLPGECVIDCSHSGSCDDDVAHWVPKIKEQVEKDNFHNKPTPDKIRAELKEYGAWDADQLVDDEENWQRLVWCAANNIREDETPDCSEPVNNKDNA